LQGAPQNRPIDQSLLIGPEFHTRIQSCVGTDERVRPYVTGALPAIDPNDLCASKLSSEGASSLFEALHVAQAAWTHVPPAVQRAVPALGVIHGLQAPVWIHALRALVSIPLLAYSPCAERARSEREVQQLALIRE
jgi:hypothetical protein